MSRSLLILALVAIVATTMVNGQAIVNTKSYYGADAAFCNGTFIDSNTTVGVCTFTTAGGQLSITATYVSGAFSYGYVFDPSYLTNCTAAGATSITETPIPSGCTFVGNGIYQVTTVIGTATPPSTFPPTAWSLNTNYRNITTKLPCSECAASTACEQWGRSAGRTGFCQKRTGDDITAGTYKATYCNAAGTRAGTVVFSDSACTNVVEADVGDIYCQHGTSSVCGGPTLPALPNTGATVYTNADCSSLHPTTSYIVAGACADGAKLSCSTTGNNTVTYTSYANLDCTGATTSIVFQNNICSAFMGQYVKATCELVPGGGSSASTASVSLVTMVIASLVAIFARSL